MDSVVNKKRIHPLTHFEYVSGPVLYWMSRDQRIRDNWALLHAQEKALSYRVPLIVLFCLVPDFLGATGLQYVFMLEGLRQTETGLAALNIPFRMLRGKPEERIPWFLHQIQAGMLITDFDPLRIKREWQDHVARRIRIPFLEVDAHNVVPCRVVSDKQEYAAYTIRPKIHRQLFEFMEPFPPVIRHPFGRAGDIPGGDDAIAAGPRHNTEYLRPQTRFPPGEKAAGDTLRLFMDKKLNRYAIKRNDPNSEAVSDLSPYLHFGQVAAQQIALEIAESEADTLSKDAFLEELIVRRELSDNFCFYNRNYDSYNGFPDWARKTLAIHGEDRRRHVYSLEQFENAETHEDLWNACQMEMVITGKMHGYMRMYWAKKILEWSTSADEALHIALTLNNRYELDGRDPNGYAGVAWAVGGVHDRAWPERPVFGKIRYMNERGCRSKFDVDRYIADVRTLGNSRSSSIRPEQKE